MQLEDESRQKLEIRDQLMNSERRCVGLQSEKDELTTALDQVRQSTAAVTYVAYAII